MNIPFGNVVGIKKTMMTIGVINMNIAALSEPGSANKFNFIPRICWFYDKEGARLLVLCHPPRLKDKCSQKKRFPCTTPDAKAYNIIYKCESFLHPSSRAWNSFISCDISQKYDKKTFRRTGSSGIFLVYHFLSVCWIH